MFVVCFGTGRCGSTPIVEVVSRHGEVGFVSNVDDKLHRIVDKKKAPRRSKSSERP